MHIVYYSTAVALLSVASCQSLPRFKHHGRSLLNNSFINSRDIMSGDYALKCVTDIVDCCNDTSVGNWRDVRGSPVHEGRNGTSCLYVTRGDGEISLNRKSGCINHASGLWRCDIPDSSGDMQSLYIYISNSESFGQLRSVSMTFTLHTGLRASVPEFTISCRTRGGPATTVQWRVNGVSVEEDSDHETSQIILDTSHNSVYDNRLRVRGRTSGNYFCLISNNIRNFFPKAVEQVTKSQVITVAGEPTSLEVVISESNSSHVNVTVSWESPADPLTGYIIYYQTKGGPVISDMVSGGETETHSLDGLQRGVTYYISILALSQHLSSLLVGPVTVVDPLLVVETSPESLTTSPNIQFSLNCTATAMLDGENIPLDLEWMYRVVFPLSVSFEVIPSSLYTRGGTPDRGYESTLTTTRDSSQRTIIYRCFAKTLYNSNFSETPVLFLDPISSISALTSCSYSLSQPLLIATTTIRDVCSSATVTSFDPTITTTVISRTLITITAMSTSTIIYSTYTSTWTTVSIATPSASTQQVRVTSSAASISLGPTTSISLGLTTTPTINEMCKYSTLGERIESISEAVAVIVAGICASVLMCLIICFLRLYNCKSFACCHKVETNTNTAYAVVGVRDDPTYDVVGPPRAHHHTATSDL